MLLTLRSGRAGDTDNKIFVLRGLLYHAYDPGMYAGLMGGGEMQSRLS